MKSRERKEIALMLIRDDLVNTKLVDGLCNMDFNAESFYLNISSVVFRLVGIDIDDPKNESIYEQYLERCSTAIYVSLKESETSFENLANEIYLFLLGEKTRLSSTSTPSKV